MPASTTADEGRTPEQLREHYEIEQMLADRLRAATREERRSLYTALYDELYRRVPHHPQLTRKVDAAAQRARVAEQLELLRDLLVPDSTFMEVGPGDCSLSIEVAKRVKRVYAVDVSEEITRRAALPSNLSLILSDGCSIPVPEASVGLAYSYQLMEHLHPEDAREQVQNIYRALVPGGAYLCVTPNRLTGPHDISRYFAEVARGFHLKEYTTGELEDGFERAGFSKIRVHFKVRGFKALLPVFPVRWLERCLETFPYSLAHRASTSLVLQRLLGVAILATK
jgi:SAM-dependent methyltransferase